MTSRNRTTRLERKLLSRVGRSIRAFQMIEEGDRVLVAMSGGKDSYAMCHLLHELQRRATTETIS